MQQTADVEILWIIAAVAAACHPAYGSSFFSAAAVAGAVPVMDADAVVEMTAACGSSFSSAAAVDLVVAAAAVAAVVDVETAAEMDAAAKSGNSKGGFLPPY